MNTLPPEIINKIFIPKYLHNKYHNYSLHFKMDIYSTYYKYKKVVNEFNDNIKNFYNEDLFSISKTNKLNYFFKLYQLSLTEFNKNKTNYNIKFKKSWRKNNYKINNNDKFVINNFVISNSEMSEIWSNMLIYDI